MTERHPFPFSRVPELRCASDVARRHANDLSTRFAKEVAFRFVPGIAAGDAALYRADPRA
jgi:hypothetical protein